MCLSVLLLLFFYDENTSVCLSSFSHLFFFFCSSSVNTSNWSWNPSSLQQTVLVFLLNALPFVKMCVFIDWLLVCLRQETVALKWMHLPEYCELIGFVNIELQWQYVYRPKMVWLSMILDWWAFGKWFCHCWSFYQMKAIEFRFAYRKRCIICVFVVSGRRSNMLKNTKTIFILFIHRLSFGHFFSVCLDPSSLFDLTTHSISTFWT